MQLLAHTCWEQLSGSPRAEQIRTEKIIRSSLELIARRYDAFYKQLWKDLTAIQRQTLKAVIHEGGKGMQSMKAVRRVGKGASTIAKSLGLLIEREILREEESAGGIRFRFEEPFFAVWIGFLPEKFK